MMMTQVESEIVNLRPTQLLQVLGVERADEIDLGAIAQFCGATIVEQPMSGCEARIIGYGNEAIITVNASSPLERRRFSAAHELGHWMMHRNQSYFRCQDALFIKEWSKANPENQANRFAADLLMPEYIFAERAAKREILFSTVSALASEFKTSLTATAIRTVEHGAFPSMLVCTEAGKRLWFVRGIGIPDSFWPVKKVQKETNAHKMLSQSGLHPEPEEVAAENWIECDRSGDYWVNEDTVRVGGCLLSLLWWKDESQLCEDEIDEGDDR